MRKLIMGVCALVVGVVSLVGLLRPAPSLAQSRDVSEVWALEDDYWRYVKAGDVESYVKLWHEKFIGWPCGQEHPARKASIGGWVQEVRDKRIKVTSDLTREGAEDFGDIVVVHYRFTRIDTYPDGRVEGQGRVSKITHTWMRVGATWQIIGGMCGSLVSPALHPNATNHGYIGDDLFGGPIQMLFDWNDQNGPATGLRARLAGIDITGTIATARLELDDWTGHKFTDMFAQLKTDISRRSEG